MGLLGKVMLRITECTVVAVLIAVLGGAASAFATERLVYTLNPDGSPDIYTAYEDGSDQTLLLADTSALDVALDFDASTIAYAEGLDLRAVNADGSNDHVILDHWSGGSNGNPAWEPAGQSLVFERMPDDRVDRDIYSVSTSGLNPTPLTDTPADDEDPTYAGDGSKIVFGRTAPDGSRNALVTMKSDGSNQRAITTDWHTFHWDPSFSPSGAKIVYSASPFGVLTSDIWKVSADGSHRVKLTQSGNAYKPSWSADGRTITYSDLQVGQSGTWAMDSDGSNKRQILPADTYSAEFRQTNRTSPNYEVLLQRHVPYFHYDSSEQYYFDSAAEATDNVGVCQQYLYPNALRQKGTVLAMAPPSCGFWELSLEFLVPGPTYSSGASVTENDFIDERNGTYRDDAERMHRDPNYGDKIYGRVVHDGGVVWLQYWLYAYYNDQSFLGVGVHEGDWEMVQLPIGFNQAPYEATYAEHKGGSTCTWDMVDTYGPQPWVYTASGSHASYFRPGTYPIGHGLSDTADGQGDAIIPKVTSVSQKPPWILWPGYWGASTWPDLSSPRGPSKQGDKWDQPSKFAGQFGCNIEDGQPIGGAGAPPPPTITADRTGSSATVKYSFDRLPTNPSSRPVKVVVTVDSHGKRFAPRSYPVSVESQTGQVTVLLPQGGPPYEVKARSYTKQMLPSKRAEASPLD